MEAKEETHEIFNARSGKAPLNDAGGRLQLQVAHLLPRAQHVELTTVCDVIFGQW